MLRFLGWVRNTCTPRDLDFTIFRSTEPPILKLIDDFTCWLVETRRCSYGTVAGYCNSLLQLVQFAIAEVLDADEAADEALVNALLILRSQAESQHRDDRRYKPLDPNFISWEDAQRTRIAAKKKFDELCDASRLSSEQRASLLKLGEDCAILHFLTYQAERAHCTATAPPPHHHCTTTAPSLHNHRSITAPSLYHRSTVV